VQQLIAQVAVTGQRALLCRLPRHLGQARPGASVTSVSTDLEPPLDFAVAEADITDAGAAPGVQIGTLGDVRVMATR